MNKNIARIKVLIISPEGGSGRDIARHLECFENIECFHYLRFDEVSKGKWNEEYIILLDVSAEGSVELPPESVSKAPALRIILFNVEADLEIEKKALLGGYKGVFLKEDSLDHIEKGMRAVLNGNLWYSRQALQDLAVEKLLVDYEINKNEKVLTAREEEILWFVASGASNKEIAKGLFLSPHTVRGHMSSIFSKIGVGNRLQATLWASKYLRAVKKCFSQIL